MNIPSPHRWQNDDVGWVTLTILALLWALLAFWLNGVANEGDPSFAGGRVAESTALVHYAVAESEYPDWLIRLAGIDDDSLAEEAALLFDEWTESDSLPRRILPHWALTLHLVGEKERAAEVLERMRKGGAAAQVEIFEAIVAGKTVSAPTKTLIEERIADETWELPEWHYSAFIEDDEHVRAWLVERGTNMIRRGLAAHALAVTMLVAAAAALVWFLAKRRSLPAAPGRRRLVSGWRVKHLLREFFVAILLGMALGIIVAMPAFLLGYYDGGQIVAGFLAMMFPLFWLCHRLSPGFRAASRLFGLRRGPWKRTELILFGLLGFGVLAAGASLLALLGSPVDAIQDTITEEGLDRPLAVAWMFVLAVILAPLSEEFVFRGFLFGGLADKWGVPGAAVFSSLVFAVMHGYTPAGLAVVFFYGMVCCWLYRRSGSLWPGIVAHASLNLVITAEVVGWSSLH